MDIFIQPVAMICNGEQYEKDLRTPLLEMGYREECIEDLEDWKNCCLLVNNYMGEIGVLTNLPVSTAEYFGRILIGEYDPKRFLYLASIKGTGTKAATDFFLKEGNIVINDNGVVGLVVGDKLKVIVQKNGDVVDVSSTEENYEDLLQIEEIREYEDFIPTPSEFLHMSVKEHYRNSKMIWKKKIKNEQISNTRESVFLPQLT